MAPTVRNDSQAEISKVLMRSLNCFSVFSCVGASSLNDKKAVDFCTKFPFADSVDIQS